MSPYPNSCDEIYVVARGKKCNRQKKQKAKKREKKKTSWYLTYDESKRIIRISSASSDMHVLIPSMQFIEAQHTSQPPTTPPI